MSRAFKRRVSGVTLFEVLLVLFVAAFIAAAVATIYAKVSLTFKQNQLQSSIQQLTANISAAYNGQYPSDEMTGVSLHNAGLVPPDMWNTTSSSPITPFDTTSASWSVTGTGTTIELSVINIPTPACTGMFQALMQISSGAPLKIDDEAVTDAPGGITACSAGGTDAVHKFLITVR